ncbi:hypothetical protein ISF6_1492 [Piscinibacter sakaiensis]|uniref:Uncharacterized protein n=1 Tax=Piscinibacter sakaiensis TaxID=1547922 RepID=A0A0K8NZL1_PISS1|nr:hypothetical protein ISF6_1492 [Piscinibacter sakaiensis]
MSGSSLQCMRRHRDGSRGAGLRHDRRSPGSCGGRRGKALGSRP